MTKSLIPIVLAVLSLSTISGAEAQESAAQSNYTVYDTQPGGEKAATVKPLPSDDAQTYPILSGNIEANQIVVNAGSRFKVELLTPISSKSSMDGDLVRCQLLDDLVVNGITVASTGDILTGQVTTVTGSRKTIKSYVPNHHFLNPEGRIGVTFITMADDAGHNTAISATLAPGSTIVPNKPDKLHYSINKEGEAEVKNTTLKYLAFEAAVAGGVVASGPIGLAAAPVVTGIAGTISPSFAQGHQVPADVPQSKVKDFLLGASHGVPGGAVVSGLVTRGADITLEAGDHLVLELNQNAVFQRYFDAKRKDNVY